MNRLRNSLLAVVLIVLAMPVFAAGLPDYEPDANHTRDQVPDAYKWDLGKLFESTADWEAGLAAVDAEIPKLDAFRGRLDEPKALRDALSLYFDLHNRASYVQQYANLALNMELTDESLQAQSQRGSAVLERLMNAAGFIREEALALDDDVMERAYADSDGPAEYRGYLDNLRRRRARVLEPEAERILALVGDNLWAEIDLNEIIGPSENAFGALLTDIAWPMIHDVDGEEVQLALSNYSRFRRSDDRAVRREAVSAFFGTLRQFQHAFAATLGGQFWFDVTFARARNYDTAIDAYLDKDGLDVAVHDNLIAAVNANLEPLHRYVELRRQVLGLDDLHIYDLYVPMVAAAEMDVPYDEAVKILPKALAPLGKDYVEILETGLDPRNGWIDIYPSTTKDSGAFSASVYGSDPYVKMNYQNGLDDLSTLAHEYGHAIHSHLAMKHQPYHGYRYVPFLAEIASTCNEALLADYLMANAKSDEEKIGLLAAELESIRGTIYRQTLFSEFEREVHAFVEDGVPITASLLDETYSGLVQRYYGPGFTVDADDGMEWAYIPHFYYKYYVYSYATGLSCGLAIAERVKELGQPAVDDYLGMLQGGCSDAPIELLKGAGVDLTRPEAIEAALERFDRTMTELAELLDVEL